MGVLLTDGSADLMLVSRKAMAVRFSESAVRSTGRGTAGVIGMRLAADDEVLALASTGSGGELISITENGYGKRTILTQEQFRTKGRGIKGVTAHTVTKRTGALAGAFVGSKEQDLFVISSSGIVIRVPASDIRRVGRISQGVRTMRVEPGAKVVAIAPVVNQSDEE